MSVWREVQETLYQAWTDGWANATPTAFSNDLFKPVAGESHVRFRVQQLPGAPGTLGSPGNRKMDRRGAVFALLRAPPGHGVATLSDLAEKARRIFEMKRFGPHDIRFEQGDIGEAAEIEAGRWWGVTVNVPFAYDELI